jgi:guanylate kinase
VSKEQFAAVVLGLLTYRIPLFLRQLLNPLIFHSSGDPITTATFLPGSAGIALQIMQNEKNNESYSSSFSIQELQPILLVSGPEGTGKSSLVKRLMNDDKAGRFVLPRLIDKIADGPRFEVMERRGQVLKIIDSRYALSLDGILNAATEEKDIKQQKVAVILDVDVDLARTLFKELSGKAKIIGVWVGLDSLDKLKDRLKLKLATTPIQFSPGETEESYIRAKIRKVIKDIEFGVVSGMFDFTILNDDFDMSLVELKEAAKYCFK